MTNMDKVGEDLSYVRAVLDDAAPAGSPAAIYYLWAAIAFAGHAIIDFRPEAAGPYWLVAGPLGGLASGLIGWWDGRRTGQRSSREGWRHGLHWTGMMMAVLLLVPLSMAEEIPMTAFPKLILLIVALGYYTAGLYLDRALLWVGMVIAGWFLVVVLRPGLPWLWTLTGAVFAASLVASGLIVSSRARRRASAGTRS